MITEVVSGVRPQGGGELTWLEFVRIGYTRLFEVRLLHHFWLDEGATVFDAIADPEVKTRRLLTYDVRRLLLVEPSAATAATIAGLRGVFRMSGLGFFVAVPDDAVVPLDASFEFFVTSADPEYANYTALSLRPQSITRRADPSRPEVIHRYKANVPVLGNLHRGVARAAGTAKRLFLSQDYSTAPAPGTGRSAGHLGQRSCASSPVTRRAPRSTSSGRRTRTLCTSTRATSRRSLRRPAPPAPPPAGSSSRPTLRRQLPPSSASSRGAPTTSAFSFAEANGTVRPSTRVFEVHLRNRWTTWRYRDKGDGAVTSTEADPLPLTHFGNAGAKQKPSTAAVGIDLDNADPPKITRLVSDIYV